MTIGELLSVAQKDFSRVGIPTAALDARILLGHVLGQNPMDVLLRKENPVPAPEVEIFDQLVQRRLKREPVSRILGHREFWSLDFGLNDHTLDPRPDSECLIDAVLKKVGEQNKQLKILDLGTGSGCLLLTLLAELPQATGVGVDKAPLAVAQARQNGAALGLSDRVEFTVSEWGKALTERFDLVISNPPYIPTADIAGLEQDVKEYDPILALDGGEDGLRCYREIAGQIRCLLNECGCVFLEIGQGQESMVCQIMEAEGLTFIKDHKDLSGTIRCLQFMKMD